MIHHLTPITGILLSAIVGILVDRYFHLSPISYMAGFLLTAMGLILSGAPWLSYVGAGLQRFLVRVNLWGVVASIFAILHFLDWWYEPADAFRRGLNTQTPMVAMVELRELPQIIPARAYHPLRRGESHPRVKAHIAITSVRQNRDGKLVWIPVSGQGILLSSVAKVPVGLLNPEKAVQPIQQVEDDERVDWQQLTIGTRLLVRGIASPLQSEKNPGGWNAAEYYWDTRRSFTLRTRDHPESLQVMGGRSEPFEWMRTETIQFARYNLRQHLRPDQFRLAAAVLLGDRFRLQPEELGQFAKGGIIHLIAISGLHVGILAAGLFLPLRWISRHRVLLAYLGLCVIWFYAVIVNLRPPVVRASILVSVTVLSKMYYRENHQIYSLSVAGLLILICNPSTLFSVGTQLSFIAVATLITAQRFWTFQLSKPAKLLLRKHGVPLKLYIYGGQALRSTMLATAAVVVVALPVTASNFHLVSITGIVLNTILSVPVVVAILSGFLLCLFGSITILGVLIGACANRAFACLWICNEWFVENLSLVVWLAGPTTVWTVSCYLILSMATGVIPTAKPFRAKLKWLLLVWILGSTALWPHRIGGRTKVGDLRLQFINVEHGTAVLMELPNGGIWLYDAGSLTDHQFAGREIADVLWSRGHSRIDGIFVSHADLDHFNAIPFLLERFGSARVMLSEPMHHKLFGGLLNRRGPAEAFLADQLLEYVESIDSLKEGNLVQVGLGQFQILGPQAGVQYESDNDASLVLLLKCQGISVLLPGDIEAQGIAQVMQFPLNPCDVVMLPHHGSIHSNPDQFSHWSQPRYAVASTGHAELAKWVRECYQPVVTARQGKIVMTSQQGSIVFQRNRSEALLLVEP